MTDTLHDDWARLSDEWCATPAPLHFEGVRDRVRKQSRRLVLLVVFEVALSLAAMAMLVSAARVARTWDNWLIIGGLTLFSAATWVFTIRNRRGVWSATGETLEAYQALEQERVVRRAAAARFSWRLSLVGTPPLLLIAGVRLTTLGWATPTLVALAGAVYLAVWGLVARVGLRRMVREGVRL